MTPTRWCLTAFATCLIAGLLLFLLDTVTSRSIRWLNNFMPMLFILAGSMLPTAAAARAWEQRRWPAIMIACTMMVGVGAVLWIGYLFNVAGMRLRPDAPYAAGILTILGSGGAFAGLMLVPTLTSTGARIVRGCGLASLILLTLQLTAWVGIDWSLAGRATLGAYWFNQFHEDMARAAGVLAVLTGTLVVATWVLSNSRSLMGDDEVRERVPFSFTCPRCGERQQGETGGDVCDACGLSISVVLL